MAQQKFLTRQEELKGIQLGRQRDPKAAPQLRKLIETVKARAIPEVLKDADLAGRLRGRRTRVLGADLKFGRPPSGEQIAPRLGELAVYDYDRNVLLIATTDLREGRVLRIDERTGIQPPLIPEEVEQAKKLVLSDRKFQALKKHSSLEVVTFPARVTFDRDSPLHGHRCFTLYFWTGGKQPRRVAEADVDLSTGQLLPAEAADKH
jgi:hypothetical protein